MTLHEYIDNPMGKGDSSIPNRDLIKQDLDQRFIKLMTKDKKIKLNVYKTMKGDIYYFHLIIPSETERDNTYDVVFQLSEAGGVDPSLKKCQVKFFSNSPSFAYTFANVYNNENLLIIGLRNKFPNTIFKKTPTIRNRYGIIGYEKYLYFGAKYLIENNLLSKPALSLKVKTFSKLTSFSSIRSLEKIEIEYRTAKEKLNKKKRTKKSVSTDKNIKTPKETKSVNVIKPKKPTNNRIKPIKKRK